jgi:hypothetical protein
MLTDWARGLACAPILVLAATVVACQPPASLCASTATPATQQTVTGKDGQPVTVTSGELAPELRDFPLPEGFCNDRGGSGSVVSKDNRLVSASWKGRQAIPEVVQFYRRELPPRGYSEDFVTVAADGSLIQFTNAAAKRSVAITLSRSADAVEIAVLMTIAP